jgi:hypothetical protein
MEAVINTVHQIYIHCIPPVAAKRAMHLDASGTRMVFLISFKTQQIYNIFNGDTKLGHVQALLTD